MGRRGKEVERCGKQKGMVDLRGKGRITKGKWKKKGRRVRGEKRLIREKERSGSGEKA